MVVRVPARASADDERANKRPCVLDRTAGGLSQQLGVDAAGDQLRVVFGVGFPARENAVAVFGIEFAETRTPASLVGGNQGGARPSEKIEHNAAAAGDVLDGVGDHLDRLHRRMEGKLFKAISLAGIGALIGPDVRSVSAMLAELESVEMGRSPAFEGEYQLVPGPVEAAHPAIVLRPDD